MVSYLTLDGSVFIAALKKDEEYHSESLKLLEEVKNGQYLAIEPLSVLIEIVAAIKENRFKGFGPKSKERYSGN